MSIPNGETLRPATERPDIPPEERRVSPRYRLRDARAIISWDDGSEHVTSVAEVLNISGGGAAVLTDRAPPVGISVRLLLECKSAPPEPLQGRSLAVAVDPSGRQLVRVQFTHWVSLDAILEHHGERRLWQRFPVRETRAKLTWLKDGSEISLRGELSNISGGGAAVIVDGILPADEPVWFELETDGEVLTPIESRLVVTSLDPSGTKIARIKFIDACPMLLFELAIHGST
jgi:PilZ domain